MIPEIVWHRKDWATIMLRHDGECLTYRRGALVAGPVALRVSGPDLGWTDVGRKQFEAQATMYVEVRFGSTRRRFTNVYEYRRPRPGLPHRTP